MPKKLTLDRKRVKTSATSLVVAAGPNLVLEVNDLERWG